MKRANKAVSAMVTLAMLAGIMIPAGSAFAFSKNSAKTVPTIANEDGDATLGTIVIAEDGSYNTDFESGQTFMVTLPSGVEFDHSELAPQVSLNGSVIADTYVKKSANNRTLTITMPGAVDADPAKTDKFEITTPVVLDDFDGGDVIASIDGLDSAVKDGTVVIGKAADGDAAVTVIGDVESIGLDNVGVGAVIEIRESAANDMNDGNDKFDIILELPSDFEWDKDTTKVEGLAGFDGLTTITGDALDIEDERLTIDAAYVGGTTRGILQITPGIIVPDDADMGEFEINVSGEGVNDTDVVVAKVADFGAAFEAEEPEDIIAGGDRDQELAEITLDEDVNDSYIPGRKVTFTFPSYVDVTGINWDGKVFKEKPEVTKDNEDDEVSFVVADDASGKTKLTFKVSVKANAPAGDLKVGLKGSAGLKGEVVAGKVIPAVTATATVKPVQLGLSTQEGGEITLVEGKKGALNEGDLIVELPDDVEWSDDPKVEVISGNVKITEDDIDTTDNFLTIPIEKDSTVASTIKISGIKLDVKSIAFGGQIEAKIKGSAVAANHYGYTEDTEKDENGYFDQAKATSVIIASATGASAGNAKFAIGSSVYYVGGAAKVMDAAPYIKNSRTYVPVRYLAYALGVADEDITYENGVVTMKLGEDVVSLTIGSTNLTVNGTVQAMDVAPEVVNGRTMLPARFVAEAFGAEVGFANNEVIIVK